MTTLFIITITLQIFVLILPAVDNESLKLRLERCMAYHRQLQVGCPVKLIVEYQSL